MDGDIELEIGSGSEYGEYTVRVIKAPAGGHASGTFRLDVDAILSRRPELEATVLASAVAARRSTPVAELPVRGVGQQLFQALFTREVYGTYRASLGAAQQSGQQLRVVLRLAAPELAAMPWEMLFDPETDSYLCQTEPLLRHIPAPDYNVNPLDIEPPLRILGIVAAPRDLPPLDVATEKDHLAQALAGPVSEGTIELVWAPSGTWDDIQSRLLAGPWHVVHFIGHGDYDSRTDEGRVALVGPDGRAAMVRAVRLMALLSVAMPRPRLVVLNSCSSGETGQDDAFSGTASTLVRSGIGAVAAMQFAISDSAAIAFAHGFYAAIANGRGVDEAARVGRISVMASPEGTLEWATPALYVRGGSTQLFTLARPTQRRADAPQQAPSGPPAAAGIGARPDDAEQVREAQLRARHAQLRALYVQASAEMRTRRYDLAVELFDDLLTLEPDYRDAVELREKARSRDELAKTYRRARDSEDAQDWMAAVEGYAVVQGDPEFPDAAARRESSERRQRIADLEGELRYHSSSGSWQAVVDVAAELERLDPSASDPDGLTTAARTHLEASRPAPAPAPEAPHVPEVRPASAPPDATATAEPARKARATEGPAPDVPAPKYAAPQGTAPVPGPAGRPASGALIASAGWLLIAAGLVGAFVAGYIVWVDPDAWYNGGGAGIRWLYGLFVPVGYVLLVLAGLPDGKPQGRAVLGGAAFSVALTGWLLDIDSEGAMAAATVFSFVASVLGIWAGMLALRSVLLPRHAGWALLVPLALLPIVFIRLEGTVWDELLVKGGVFLVIHFVLLTLSGALLAAAARTAGTRSAGPGTAGSESRERT